MPIQKDDDPNLPQQEQPSEELPPGNGDGDGDPHPTLVRITQVSPIGGALAGGIDVTLTGSGFQPDAQVFFGSNPSPEVTFNSSTSLTAKLPPATQTGSVSVTLANPDGTTATLPGGFTYVTTEASLHAEVHGVSPLSVIEDTESEITIRGRNLIAAFNDGIIVLRGPGRVHITSSNFDNSTDAETGIESLVLTVRVTATPPLEQHERMAVQVLASTRPGAASDGVFESSRQMFTVLPRAVPVLLAYTADLIPDRPNLVVVAGKNLSGYSLSLGQRATLHAQSGDDETLSAIVSFISPEPMSGSVPLTVLDSNGGEAAQFEMSFKEQSKEVATLDQKSEATTGESAQPGDGGGPIGLTLTPVPGQELVGPTSQDSAVFSLGGTSLSDFSFNFFEFEFVIFERDIIIPLFNEVRLIPFFDNGIGDVLNDTPVVAEVGKLLRLRGMGLLVALRVDLIIHIEIVLIIGFRFDIWDFGLFNEFPEFGWAIGSIVISIRVIISVFLQVAFLVALVKPGGHLRVLFFFNLSLGFDFTITTDGRSLHFDRDFIHRVDYTKVSPLHTLLLCDGSFQLAEENGEVAFTDGFGGSQSFYFPRAEGQCCLPWEFDLRLVQFKEGGPEEVVQENFRAEFCLNAAPPTNVVNLIITSQHPEPTGIGPTRRLTMTFDDRAKLLVLGEPADASGTPTGAPAVDITTLGYNVEFYLDPLFPDLFNPTLLPSGDAVPVQAGDNFIHARISHPGEAQLFNFRPEDISGFEIERFIAQGLLPALLSAAVLPVTVQDPTQIAITPTLAFRHPQTHQLTESPSLFTLQGEPVREIERYEPWEYDATTNQPQQLDYLLAARVSFPANTSFPVQVKFTIKANGVKMMVLVGNNATPESKPPLENLPGGTGFGSAGPGFGSPRATDNDPTHFFAKMVQPNQSVTINFQSKPAPGELVPLKDSNSNAELTIAPNIRDEGAGHLVPPGKLVADRQVMLLIDLDAETVNVNVSVRDIKQLKLAVRNDETFEEYLRVFPDVRTILTGDFRDFAKGFYGRLPEEGPPASDLLDREGKRLWNLACTAVQTTRDDRPLYWARLQAIGALRAYYKRNRLGQPDVTQFEWPSRGLELDGSISFEGVTNPRKAIFTGFDPFALIYRPSPPSEPFGSLHLMRSNPSGLAALDFNKKSFGSASALVDVRTAIFPVRYDDFDHNLIEKAVTPNLGSIVLLMTCSDNSGRDFYDVERWAGKMRGNDILDNNRRAIDGPSDGVSAPGGDAASGPQFLESTLPYELVIATPTDKLPGPERTNTPFVMDQSYKIVGATKIEEGKWRLSPDSRDTDLIPWFTKLPERPLAGATAEEGSGGNYLSNEIFYRSALVRQDRRPALPSGHFHVPSTDTDPTGKGPALIDGVRMALNRLLAAALRPRLRSATDLAFPDTLINASRSLTLTATNDTTETITVNAAEVEQPFTAQLPSPPPIRLSPGDTLSLTLTFTPTAEARFIRAVRVRNTDGDLVLACTLVGTGVRTLPAPQITSFDPTSGHIGDDVTINGNNLDGATAVRIGGGTVGSAPVSPSEITATVTVAARTGHIEVDTPSGTATSAGTFFVIRRPPPPEDLAAQLKARRAELGLAPKDAALQIGASASTYRRWESGEDRPSARFNAAVATFLGRNPNPDPKEFGQLIRATRERDGLTRSQLAQRLGVSSSTVRSWETGEVSRPTPRVAGIFDEYVREE
jgi:transcriptional regulator with XRE-family HTH domain/pyrrolidone-carboxylate peptidase